MHLAVLTVFVARATETLDDPNRRASFASIAGFGASAKTVDGLEILDGGDGLVDCGYLTTGKLLREGAKSLDSQSDEV